MSIELPNLDNPCSEYFCYRDLIEVGDTFTESAVTNVPARIETYNAMRRLAESVLDPVVRQFGMPIITYGFSSAALIREIRRKNHPLIAPALDQHAGCELNTKDSPICKRLGFAVDFFVPSHSSLVVARWIVSQLPFDRLYFYGSDRPFHVSVGPDDSGTIVYMRGARGHRHQPIKMGSEKFLTRFEDV